MDVCIKQQSKQQCKSNIVWPYAKSEKICSIPLSFNNVCCIVEV